MTEQRKVSAPKSHLITAGLLIRIPLTVILSGVNYLFFGDFFKIIYTLIAPAFMTVDNIPFYVAFAVCGTMQVSLDQIQVKARSQLTRGIATIIDGVLKLFGIAMVTVLNWDTIKQTSFIKLVAALAPPEQVATYEIVAGGVTVLLVAFFLNFIDRAAQEV